MIHRFFALVFAGLLVMAAPNASTVGAAESQGNEPRARAWAVRVSLTSAAENFIQIGDVSADAGARPTATGSAYLVGGQGSGTVIATLDNPDATKADIDQIDPTGSMHIEGGFAEAHANSQGSSARAGIGNATGNGFAIASQYFSFEQQTQTLTTWVQLQDAIFTPLNSVIDQLNPLLGTTEKSIPHFQPAPAAGLIDVATGRNLAGNAHTTGAPGYNSASSDATLGELKLLGGFIELHGVAAQALSSSSNGVDERSASSTIGKMYIAGIEVVQDGDGFRVAGNDLVSRSVIQPSLDLAITQLESAGMTLRFAETTSRGDLREATAFELSWLTDSGLIDISIGHAEASAESVGAPADFGPACCPVTPGPGVTPPVVSGVQTPGVGPTGPGPVPPSVTSRSGPTVRSLGPAAARAIRTAYLIFLVAGFVASMGYPMFVRRHWSRRRTVLA